MRCKAVSYMLVMLFAFAQMGCNSQDEPPAAIMMRPEYSAPDPEPVASIPNLAIANAREIMSKHGPIRVNINWNRGAPTTFQGVDRFDACLDDASLVCISLDEIGRPLYATYFSEHGVIVADSVTKTVKRLTSVHPDRLIATGDSSDSFARRQLLALLAISELERRLNGAASISVAPGESHSFLKQIYRDEDAYAVEQGAHINIQGTHRPNATELIVQNDRRPLLSVEIAAMHNDAIRRSLDVFSFVNAPTRRIERPRIRELAEHLKECGLEISKDIPVVVDFRDGRQAVVPLNSARDIGEQTQETIQQTIQGVRVSISIAGPISVRRESIIRSDSIVVARLMNRGRPTAVVANIPGQDWAIGYMLTLDLGVLGSAVGEMSQQDLLEKERMLCHVIESRMTPMVVRFVESLSVENSDKE